MTFTKSNLYFWSWIFMDVLLYLPFFFFLLSLQWVILKNSVIFSNLFSEQCCFCLSAQASVRSDKCSCWTIYVTFLCATFLSPLVCVFLLLQHSIWPWPVFVFPSRRCMLCGTTALESFSVCRSFPTVTSRCHFLKKARHSPFSWYQYCLLR